MIRNKSKGYRGDDRAVSPVVGVALLIAITVVLAAVIGFVVLSSSNQTTDVPSARLDVTQQSDGDLTISHEGGDAIDTSNIEVVYGNTRNELTSYSGASDTEISTGSEITISGNWAAGDTVKVVWDDPDSDRKSQLTSFTVQ